MDRNISLSLGKFIKGNDGHTPRIGPNGNWWIEGEDTGIQARGEDGRGVYEIAVENGYPGTEQEFYAALSKLGRIASFTESEWSSLSLSEQAAIEWAVIYED